MSERTVTVSLDALRALYQVYRTWRQSSGFDAGSGTVICDGTTVRGIGSLLPVSDLNAMEAATDAVEPYSAILQRVTGGADYSGYDEFDALRKFLLDRFESEEHAGGDGGRWQARLYRTVLEFAVDLQEKCLDANAYNVEPERLLQIIAQAWRTHRDFQPHWDIPLAGEVVHGLGEGAFTSCCKRLLFELVHSQRVTDDPARVTCRELGALA